MEFKVGQKVECLLFGKGIIKKIRNDKEFSILVLFENEDFHWYSKEKKYHRDGRVTLTPGTWNIEEILPEPEYEKGQPVWIRYKEEQEWRLRYYSHKEGEKHFVYCEQKKSGVKVSYNWIKHLEGKDPNN